MPSGSFNGTGGLNFISQRPALQNLRQFAWPLFASRYSLKGWPPINFHEVSVATKQPESRTAFAAAQTLPSPSEGPQRAQPAERLHLCLAGTFEGNDVTHYGGLATFQSTYGTAKGSHTVTGKRIICESDQTGQFVVRFCILKQILHQCHRSVRTVYLNQKR